jgi:hypothetical protein
MLQDLRDRGDLSRETIHDELSIDQEAEARRREREKEKGYDEVFAPTNVPFDSPNKMPNGDMQDPNSNTEGRRGGGNSNGGGANPDSFVTNATPVRPRTGENG